MPLFRHKGHHGGRYDDPHGVTAPAKKAMPVGTPEKIQIDSTPEPLPELSKKEQKRKAKGLKEINSPKSRAQGARRNEMYKRAKAAEERRPPKGRGPLNPTPGPDTAFIKGGFKGIDKYDKETTGGKLLTPSAHRMAAITEEAEATKKRTRFYS